MNSLEEKERCERKFLITCQSMGRKDRRINIYIRGKRRRAEVGRRLFVLLVMKGGEKKRRLYSI